MQLILQIILLQKQKTRGNKDIKSKKPSIVYSICGLGYTMYKLEHIECPQILLRAFCLLVLTLNFYQNGNLIKMILYDTKHCIIR